MADTFPSALGNSWRMLFAQSGFRRGGGRALLMNVAVVLAFGMLIPWYKGIATYDPVVVFAFSFIPLLYAVPGAADLVSRYSPAPPAVACARIVGCALYAWTILAVIYALALLTVNIMYRTTFFHPSWRVLGSAALFGFFLALFTGAATVVLGVLFSATTALHVMRLLLLAALLALVTSGQWLPERWNAAIARHYTARGLTRAGLAGAAALAGLSGGLMIALAAAWRTRHSQ